MLLSLLEWPDVCVSGTEKWRRPSRLWNTGTVAERRPVALLCSTCSSTTSTPSWGISRAASLCPLAPPARSCPAPLKEADPKAVWTAVLTELTMPPSPHTTHSPIHTLTHTQHPTTAAHTVTRPLKRSVNTLHIRLVGKTEGLHLKGLKEGTTETELGNTPKRTALQQQQKGDTGVLCGLYSEQRLCGATSLWTCFEKSHRGSKMTLGKMILQTYVRISIFLQDRYNPRLFWGVFLFFFSWVAVGTLRAGILPQQHSWWWPCGLSFFFFFFFLLPSLWWRWEGGRGEHQPPPTPFPSLCLQADHQAL